MLIILHILIVLSALAISLMAVVRPGAGVVRASYALLAGTVASGALLVIMQPQTLTHACVSGLIVTVASLAMTRVAVRKLATDRA